MAEISLPWGGTELGDSGPYSHEVWSDFWSALFNDDRTTQGYIYGFLNDLAPSGVVTPVAVATGGALVDGIYYHNSAIVEVAVPTPGGDTRIDRIVVRKTWAAQTARITRIVGVEGGGVPALVQIEGVTWDIPICQASITTLGVITITDERVPIESPIGSLIVEGDPTLSATLDCADQAIDDAQSLNFNDGGTVDVILDEDDMASDDDDALATQQSIKAYTDSSCFIETGEYTGDGAVSFAINLTDTDMVIKYIQIIEYVAAEGISKNCVWTNNIIVTHNASGLCHGADYNASGFENMIIALGTGSFTVDDDGNNGFPNTSGTVYEYTVWGTR